MAVSKAQTWTTPASGDPSGTVTLGSGTNRCLILVQCYQLDISTFTTASASAAIGGKTATGFQAYYLDMTPDTRDGVINVWYWDETAIASMSATPTISYSDDEVLNDQLFTYATFASCDQTTPLTFYAVTATTSSDTINVVSNASTEDYVAVPVYRHAGARDVTAWDTLTEQFDFNEGVFRFALGDGSTNDTSITLTGDGINGAWLAPTLIFNAFQAVTTVSGSGTPSGIIATIAGVGERVITGIGSAAVVAAIVSAIGSRVITATGSASGPNVVVYGNDSGGFVVAVPVQTTITDDPIGKSVQVQGL